MGRIKGVNGRINLKRRITCQRRIEVYNIYGDKLKRRTKQTRISLSVSASRIQAELFV